MKIVSIILTLLLLFFINLFFVKSIYKNEQSYNVPLNVLFSKGKNIRKRLCNECFFKNEVNLIYNSCRALERVNYHKFNRSKIFYFVKESPKFLKRYVSLRSVSKISDILSVRSLTTFLSERASLLTNSFYLLEGTYIKNNILRGLVGFFGTLVLRFLVVYLVQLAASFLLFHYVNIVSQKTQAYILEVSGSNYFSRIIGFFQLNLVNYYLNVAGEFVQAILIRVLFNQYEGHLIKTIIYNSSDYYINTRLTNKYQLLYQCTKKFVLTRINKLSLFTFNYMRYFVLTNLFFKISGGTYNKFSPSDVKMPGVYSNPKKSLNKDMKYATKREIEVLRRFCKETGCHTCGVSCHDRFIGDHQPPVQVIKDMIQYYKKRKFLRAILKFFKLYDTKQRLYPQCIRCSQLQSASVRCKKQRLIPHYNTIRLFHVSSIFHLALKMLLLTQWNKIVFWDGDNIR
ncbi:conserved Plasmodium protein, unknown function [Plasmodium knowlesi strain H]|uniref:Uncharacterized protein n=3 Tax=Plasmodium knowlesi TaxID=5850 RepID=A0A5K1VC22_PLAKH|nr:conserved protein, unknown function [Plasmodium knowlesi strain H]OTN68100.1 Uncharacterized protein PKNOH_S04350300 [Plasmodium knowlesi]CAA9990184.1 conserved protein, unknown function [Plasmodium knowlesi strain H]SBO27465.1 conserved Plasmodium protein, unknown function [Plasmodium knowlesi strain H]SBO28492.1 conserved Plasmodium protein, unknown function [Plasmodium knowlesi strain H]VVS79658.1 conserved protein, unknown function [Plasmodium knowlesi strain H]|eukprot:XP_002258117.1 hypothetical protein, conserved in Plasmodium species [Plasmodium knowlesi strain H]